MKTLRVHWQRLVDERGRTCDRCGATETAVEEAVGKLTRSLEALGIDVVLEKTTLSPAAFLENPVESNRIWVAGEPIESLLSATSGQSKCCSTCGESECRTLMVDGKTYEAIPAELIVEAGLHAAARLIHGESEGACCPPAESTGKAPGCCPAPAEPRR